MRLVGQRMSKDRSPIAARVCRRLSMRRRETSGLDGLDGLGRVLRLHLRLMQSGENVAMDRVRR